MFKEFILFIKYPYTAGVIITIWLGSAALMAINRGLPAIKIVVIDMVVTVVIALLGFNGKSER
jgi:type III secretory pathway component EscT